MRTLIAVLLAMTSIASADPLRIEIAPKSHDDHVTVVLTNTSTAPLKIFREAYSWGYFGVSLELTTPDGKTIAMKKRDRGWDKNYPAVDELAPGKSLELEESITSDEWVLPAISGPVLLRAVYHVDPDADSKQQSAWTGTIRSAPTKYTWPMNGLLDVTIASVRGDQVHVVLTNLGTSPLKIFTEQCSWGYSAVSFEAMTSTGQIVTLAKKPRGWRANAPLYDEVAPGKSIERDEVLTPDVWSLPSKGKLTLRAVFTVPRDDVSKLGAWIGTVRSPYSTTITLK